MDHRTELIQAALREYASALRGDWSNIDGRSEKHALNCLADLMDPQFAKPSLAQLREILDLCPDGQGHRTERCTADCDQT